MCAAWSHQGVRSLAIDICIDDEQSTIPYTLKTSVSHGFTPNKIPMTSLLIAIKIIPMIFMALFPVVNPIGTAHPVWYDPWN